jgi:cytochrome c556
MHRVRFAVLLGLTAGVAYLGSAYAAEGEIKDVKGCMAFQGKVRGSIGDLSKKDPKWDEIQKETKGWVAMAEKIGELDPPKGDKKGWKVQTDKYLADVKRVDAAAEKKDSAALGKAMDTIKNECGMCHSKHKPAKAK